MEVTSIANDPTPDYLTESPDDDLLNYPQADFVALDNDLARGETGDVMLLAMVVDCGQLHLRGGALTVDNDINHLLANQVGLPSVVASAIVAIIPDSIKNAPFASSQPGDFTTAFLAAGDIEEVDYALSQVTFLDALDNQTCTLLTFVTDLGGNGMPLSYNSATNVEIPIPGFELGTTTYQVGAGAAPNVTIEQQQIPLQPDTTSTSPIHFTAHFDQDVTGFDSSDVDLLASTAGGTLTAAVSGGPADYTVDVTGMTSSGDVIASIPAGAATAQITGAPSAASTTGAGPDDDNIVHWVDATAPSVTINQGSGQADPTSTAPILFDVVFSEPVSGFDASDVSFAGSTAGGTLVAGVSGAGVAYTVSVSGMTSSGTVVASILAGAAQDAAANPSLASTSTDNTVTWQQPAQDTTPPSVTINQASGQADPTSAVPILFDVVFSEAVTGFDGSDVSFAGSTAGGTLVAGVSGAGVAYTVSVSGMTSSGTVVASILAGAAQDAAANPSLASTSTDNTVAWDTTAPSVTISLSAGQTNPASTPPVHFTVVFSETVTGFEPSDVSFAGSTAPGALVATITPISAVVQADGTVVLGADVPMAFDVAVSGMTGAGVVAISLNAGAVTDSAGNPSLASTSTGSNSVLFLPEPTTVPPTTTPLPTASPTLPSTGTDSGPTSWWAFALLAAGLALVVGARRRPTG